MPFYLGLYFLGFVGTALGIRAVGNATEDASKKVGFLALVAVASAAGTYYLLKKRK